MIVVDASAAVSALLRGGRARHVLIEDHVHAPHLVDYEVASALRRQVRMGRIAPADGWRALDTWRRLGLSRHPGFAALDRIWELRDTLSAYDAAYVALAESLDCALLTADGRLARATGIRCPVTVVPS